MGALGTDTGGSVRQPGALTNTVALKPTYGRVSRYGLVAFASSLDQVGHSPVRRATRRSSCRPSRATIRSTRLRLNVPVPDYTAALTGDISGLRVGVPKEYFGEGAEPGVSGRWRPPSRHSGARRGDWRVLPATHALWGGGVLHHRAGRVQRQFGALRRRQVWLSVRNGDDDPTAATRAAGFGAEVKRRIMLGAYALSSGYYDAYYLKAEKVRTLIRSDFASAFERFDVLVAPTSPTVAFKIGAKVSDPYAMYLNDVYTIPTNLAGNCGISIPGGFSEGLPVGLQLIGPNLGEATLLRVADAFQRVTDFHTRWPDLPGARAKSRKRH